MVFIFTCILSIPMKHTTPLHAAGQNVQREEMAAGNVLEREDNKNEGGDFQNPKRQHCHRIRDEELQQCR